MFCRYLNLEGERHGMAILPGWFFFLRGVFFGDMNTIMAKNGINGLTG